MKKVEKVVWGIIGAGDVCEKKSAPAMWKMEHSEVKTVMRRNAHKAEDFAKRHGISNWTTHLDVMLNDDEINAIYIATPPSTHAELTVKAAAAGKAVYVEKPMATTVVECNAMIEACANAKVPLYVAYYRRVLPGFLKVKELIESGSIGQVSTVNIELLQPLRPEIDTNTANWRVHPEIAGGGYFHDLASHQLDYLDFLFGKIVESKGVSSNKGNIYAADDTVTANFQFESGVVGVGNWCFCTTDGSEKDKMIINGTSGKITFNCFGTPMIIAVNRADGTQKIFQFTHEQPIQEPLIQLVVNELCGKGSSPSTGVTGARTTWVMEQITKG
jgi:predicted dehydrogenase